LTELNWWNVPLLYALIMFICVIILHNAALLLNLCGYGNQKADEGLATYFEALDDEVRQSIINREKRMREKYQLKKLSDWQL
jgi:hypothetical protein